MILLIEYDRTARRLLTAQEFDDASRDEADRMRLSIEQANTRRGILNEVVTLEAASRKDLERTHARYFESLTDLAAKFIRLAGAA